MDLEEGATAQTFNSPPVYIMLHRAEEIRNLAKAGHLDSIRQTAMINQLGSLDVTYGICERIQYTPFPRQIANFGYLFTWKLVFLLPLALSDVFEDESKNTRFQR